MAPTLLTVAPLSRRTLRRSRHVKNLGAPRSRAHTQEQWTSNHAHERAHRHGSTIQPPSLPALANRHAHASPDTRRSPPSARRRRHHHAPCDARARHGGHRSARLGQHSAMMTTPSDDDNSPRQHPSLSATATAATLSLTTATLCECDVCLRGQSVRGPPSQGDRPRPFARRPS